MHKTDSEGETMSNRELIERLEGVLTNHRYESIFTGCDGFSQSEIETMEETIELLKSQEWRTDMENAPRDLTNVLLSCPRQDGTRFEISGYFDANVQEWLATNHDPIYQPDHWRPLPPMEEE